MVERWMDGWKMDGYGWKMDIDERWIWMKDIHVYG